MNRLETFLQDMSYHIEFEFLEEGKNKDELADIAKKRGIVLPAHDLAVFKGRYAYVDRMNKNHCTLPKEEVERALDTLVGKSVDFDHFRKNVVGYWIDAKIVKDEIIAYGIFFKGNFPEDFELVKKLFEAGNLSISFEAWGDRNYNPDGDSYSLSDIEFAGGALLLKTEPAFDGAGVLEMAQKKRVLEMAKVLKEPKKFVHTGADMKDVLEQARLYASDMESIYRAISEVENLDGSSKGMFDILSIDFEKNKVRVKDIPTGGELMIDLTPKTTVMKKGKSRNISKVEDLTQLNSIDDIDVYINDEEKSDREVELIIEQATEGPKISYTDRAELTDEDFAIVKNIKLDNSNRKIRLFPIPTLAHITNVLDRLGQSQVLDVLDKLGMTIDNVERKILRRAMHIAMKNLLEKYGKNTVEEVLQEVSKDYLKRELTAEELEKAYSIIDYTKPKGTANPTSLMKVPTKKSDGNETSLINAEITEDEIKKLLDEISKGQAEEQVPAEEAPKEEAPKEEAPKEEAPKEEAPKEEAPAESIDEKDKEIARLKEIVDKNAKAEKEAKIKSRREELGEIATAMKDEDILDEHKYELAKKDKLIAELQAGKVIKKPDLTKGAEDKEVDSIEKVARAKVNKYAFGEEKEEK